jgi:hypothetical protein
MKRIIPHMPRRSILIIFMLMFGIFLSPTLTLAQDPVPARKDTVEPARQDTIDPANKEDNDEQKIEHISTTTESDIDYTDLLQGLEYYRKHPLNLNTATAAELKNLYMLNDIQISNLLTHIEKNGKLFTIFELQTVDGFDLKTINDILPYVKVTNESKARYTFHDILKYSTHELTIRYTRIPEQQKGYSPISDSALAASPNSRYLGSPDKLFFRYRYRFYKKISFCILGEKDAGEQFFKGTQKNGFDFYSAHLMVNDIGIIKTVVLGDYHVQFGQGLTLWSGMGFGKSADVINIKKIAAGMYPASSASEGLFMRGIATTLAYKGVELSLFYSRNKIDANITGIDSISSEIQYISSLQSSGLHTTPSEMADRKVLLEQVFGGHLCYQNRRLNVGVTACQSIYGAELQKTIQPYNQFDFNGKHNFNFGVDYSYIFSNINFFGEASRSYNGGMAFLDGLMICLDPHVSVSLLYRNFQKDYQAMYTSAFSESRNVNEEGIFTGLSIKFNPKWELAAYCDYYNFNWLRSNADAPTKGQDYIGELSYTPNKRLDMYLRYRYEQKEENNSDASNIINYPEGYHKQSIRFNLSYQITPTITVKDRVEISGYRKGSKPAESGYLVYQDIRYKPEKLPFSIVGRYALFQANDYNVSIYAYESDMVGSFSIPSFYYKGSRFYIMAKFDIGRHFDIWLRYAITNYSNKNVISSGLTEIDGNHKSEIKAQVTMKF